MGAHGGEYKIAFATDLTVAKGLLELTATKNEEKQSRTTYGVEGKPIKTTAVYSLLEEAVCEPTTNGEVVEF